MKVKNFIVKQEEYKGNVFYTLYVLIDEKEYKIGTIKESTNCNFINCVHKEFKKN